MGKFNLGIFIIGVVVGIISILSKSPGTMVISLGFILLGVVVFVLRQFVGKVLR